MVVRLKRLALLLLPPLIAIALSKLKQKLVPAYLKELADAGAPPSKEVLAAEPQVLEWEIVPDNDATWRGPVAWSHQSIVDVQLAKWTDFLGSVRGPHPLGQPHEAAGFSPTDVATHNTIISFGYALGRAGKDKTRVSVLDWGGGLGHYFVYARALQPELELDFVVKDMPGLCEAGRKLLPTVTFVSEEERALNRSYDFVFASSAIHYSRDRYRLLRKLCDSARDWIMITRTPFVERSEEFVILQRPHAYGYMCEYPGWVLNKTRFLSFMTECGFELERQFLVAEQPYLPNAPEQPYYYGFLFRRQQPSPTSAP